MGTFKIHDGDKIREAVAALQATTCVRAHIVGRVRGPWNLVLFNDRDEQLLRIRKMVLTVDSDGLCEADFFVLDDTPYRKRVELSGETGIEDAAR